MPRAVIQARPRRTRKEQGFLLLGAFVSILVSGIMASLVAQEWSVVEKREREAQYMFVQEQYAAAILRFQQDQGRFPTKLEELTEQKGQKNQLFIRRPYTDPITRSKSLEDWCLLKVGAAGRVVSSCSDGSDPNQLGLGSSFGIGEEIGEMSSGQQIQGIDPGASGVVGVHSKSTDTAFNVLKRGEQTYNLWHYTFDQYEKDRNARGIPGVTQGQGQGTGQQPGIGNQPDSGNSFGGSSGFGGSSTRQPRSQPRNR
ncbi:MAG: type II secretion system protein [Acidobacteria bacterium]|nr:type II secretion system protein [Acidobacteriota bacterium]